jgi:hypothetical protein
VKPSVPGDRERHAAPIEPRFEKRQADRSRRQAKPGPPDRCRFLSKGFDRNRRIGHHATLPGVRAWDIAAREGQDLERVDIVSRRPEAWRGGGMV